MADNVLFQTTNLATVPNGTIVATDEVTYSGDTSKVQIVQLSSVAGVEGSKTIEKIEGTAANGLETDVTRIASAASPDIGAVADAAIVTDTTGSLSGKLRGLVKWAFERMPASLGQKLMAASLPVVIASDQGALAVTVSSTTITGTVTTKETRAATSTVTSVNDTASSTTLLASNANRLGATVYNDSTVNLYLKLGATASASSFTVLMLPGAYYEVPFAYTGVIDGIWASDASGKALMTELTA